MKRNITIIGAGQLGSRHLQSILNLEGENNIFLVDPSSNSLNKAKEVISHVRYSHILHFCKDYSELPTNIDLAIIATNSNIREKVTKQLISKCDVSNLILEKVLFQSLSSYKNIGKLIEKKNIKTWVNHPRRMFETYILLKSKLNKGTRKVYNIVGGNWGLGCNGLHLLDLITFLSDSDIQYVDSHWLDNEVIESKRKGFIEFTGTLKGRLKDNSVFQITSFQGDSSPLTISVLDASKRFIIQEGTNPKIYFINEEFEYKLNQIDHNIPYQSELTCIVANRIFENTPPGIPTYEEARKTHELFVASLLGRLNEIKNSSEEILPIT